MEKEKEINVILLGDKGVGKTSIFNAIKENSLYKNNYNIDDIDNFVLKRKYEKKDLIISLNIKDIKNQDNYKGNIPLQYIRDIHIVLLVFSNIESLNNIKERWYKFYNENANIKNSRFILIGNKSDTFGEDRDNILKQGNIFVEEIDAHFLTCSVKSKDNMDNVERYITTEAKGFIDEEEKRLNENNNISIKIENEMENEDEDNTRRKSCCLQC